MVHIDLYLSTLARMRVKIITIVVGWIWRFLDLVQSDLIRWKTWRTAKDWREPLLRANPILHDEKARAVSRELFRKWLMMDMSMSPSSFLPLWTWSGLLGLAYGARKIGNWPGRNWNTETRRSQAFLDEKRDGLKLNQRTGGQRIRYLSWLGMELLLFTKHWTSMKNINIMERLVFFCSFKCYKWANLKLPRSIDPLP